MATIGSIGPSAQPLEGPRRRVDPYAYGAGVASALGQLANTGAQFAGSLQDLSDAETSLADSYREREDQLARYQANLGLSQLSNQLEQELLLQQQSVAPGAPNFTNNISTLVRTRGNEYLATLPPDLQPEFHARLEPVLGQYEVDAFRFEFEEQNRHAMAQYNTELQNSLARVHENPDAFETEARRLAQFVQTLPTSVVNRDIVVQATRQSLQEALFYGTVQSSHMNETSVPIVNVALPPIAAQFLGAVSGRESAHRYNVRFDGSGTGARFTDYSKHPNVPVRIPEGFTGAGSTSTAAGRYQILHSTWTQAVAELAEQGINIPDFSPKNQDTVAWYIARRDYAKKTGRSIEEDLASNPGMVREALVSTWEGLGSLRNEDFSATLAAGPPNLMSDARFDAIPFDKRLSLQAKAENLGDARRRDLQNQFLEGFEDEMAFRGTTGQAPPNSPYTDEAITKLFDAPQAAELIATRDRVTDDGEMFSNIALATPEEVATYLHEAGAAVQDPENFKWDAERLDRLQKMVAARSKELAEDPVNYLLRANPKIAEAREAVQDAKSAETYAMLVQQEQTRLGVHGRLQRTLTVNEAKNLVSTIAAAPVEEQAAMLRAQLETWGPASDRVLNELYQADLSPSLYHASRIATTSPTLASEITTRIGEDIKFASDEATSIRKTTSEAFSEFETAVLASDVTGEGLTQFQELLDVANSVVELRVKRGASAAQAAEDVYKEMISSQYEIRNSSRLHAFIPREFNADKIEDAAEAMIPSLTGFSPLIFTGVPEVDSELTAQTIADQAFWVTNDDETGLALVVPTSNSTNPAPLPVRSADGGVIEVSFKDLMATPDRPSGIAATLREVTNAVLP